jgi:cell division protein FtsW
VSAKGDKFILVVVALLIIIGLTAVYSSTAVMAPGKGKAVAGEITQFAFLKKQLLTVCIGLVLMVAAYKVPLEHLRRLVIPLLLVALVALLLVFSPLGMSAGGARRWLRLWPSSFQPSELVKLSMVVFMAWYMSRTTYDRERFFAFVVPICIMGAFQIVFMMQPDFGATMSLAVLTITMLYLSGTRVRYLLSLGLLALPVVVKLMMEPYRLKRVVTFLDPWKDPQGSGFQLTQSFIAFGSGGLQGVGLGESKQKLAFLPEVHTDFIFSLIGEELGFIGAAVVVLLFFALFLRGFAIARKIDEPFAYYLAAGLSLMIAVQAAINFAVVSGLAPTKGLPLPFISYGGSSLVVNMIAAGLLLNVSRYRRAAAQADPAHEVLHIETNLLAGNAANAAETTVAGTPQLAYGRGYAHFRSRNAVAQRTLSWRPRR